jgi:hypothetical protein
LRTDWNAPITTGPAARASVSSSIAREIASSVRLRRRRAGIGSSPAAIAP